MNTLTVIMAIKARAENKKLFFILNWFLYAPQAALSGLFTVMSELPPLRPLLFKFGLKAVNNLDNAAKGAAPTVNSWPLSPSVARNQFFDLRTARGEHPSAQPGVQVQRYDILMK